MEPKYFMKINIEELEESKRVKLVSDVVSGKISHQDVLKGDVFFCNDCDQWENSSTSVECSLIRSWVSLKSDLSSLDNNHIADSVRYLVNGNNKDENP